MTPKPDEGVTLPPLDENDGRFTPNGYLANCLQQREAQLLSTLQQLETAKGLLMETIRGGYLDRFPGQKERINEKIDLFTDREGE